ncbi:hypothetical protein D3A95_04285 [Thermosynechococcus sichuanensis E542]|uniref:Uncharacterized protein n=1 Tax=Thermosynechococcus sichuanensis E542 TaxID=2016101 RepID=A0A7D6EVN5_9CYAN|nr:hypothetical protein [Thermosynechococcus vestitus]QLL29879.1 hypothetical protein D3A95_04285 [Thermosynechococcus vestitus E542]
MSLLKKSSITLTVLSAVSLGGGAIAAPYPPEVVSRFTSECTTALQQQVPQMAQYGNAYCTCVINELQSSLTLAEFQAIGENVQTNVTPEVRQMLTNTAQTCLQRVTQ